MDLNFPEWFPPFVVSQFLSPEECANIIHEAEGSGKFVRARVQRQDGTVGVLDDHCVADIATFFPDSAIWREVMERVYRHLPTLNHHYRYSLFDGTEKQLVANVSVMRYDAKRSGKFAPHVDVAGRKGAENRKLSVVVPLNDPSSYEGGRLIIDTGEKFDAFDHATVGNAVAFSSTTMHGVTPVVKGVRYTLVFFLQGPQFR